MTSPPSTVTLVAAVARNGVIGDRGDIPWRLPGEQARFKALTMGHVLVMGRRTYESIGRLLPGRTTVVVTMVDQVTGKPGGCVDVDTALGVERRHHGSEDPAERGAHVRTHVAEITGRHRVVTATPARRPARRPPAPERSPFVQRSVS